MSSAYRLIAFVGPAADAVAAEARWPSAAWMAEAWSLSEIAEAEK